MAVLVNLRRASPGERANFIALALFVVLVFATGGSARADAASLPLVHLAAAGLIVVGIAQRPSADSAKWRWPLLCLAAIAGVIAAQLVPLPPAIWRALPGRSAFAQGLDLIALGNGWRPLSMTPDATLSSLVALLPPIAVLVLGRRTPRLVGALLPVVLLCAAASALLAILQAVGAAPALYRISSLGAAIGLFANRNHQAAMLVCTIPLLAAWSVVRAGAPAFAAMRPWIALLAGALVLPLLLITGSRAGLLLGLVAIVAAIVLARPDRVLRGRGGPRRWVIGAIVAVVIAVPALLAVAASRDEALQRLLGGSAGDRRVEWASIFWRMAWDFFPFGSGFGSFESVFRGYEPFEGLADTYLNNAHNDLVEMIIEGGLFALLPLAAFLAWYLWSSRQAWRAPSSTNDRATTGRPILARAASVILAILLAWSVVDYPLRTPTLAVLAAICCLFLHVDASHQSPVDRLAGGKRSATGMGRRSKPA